MKIRQHRGSLNASMATMEEIEPTMKALVEFIQDELLGWGISITKDRVHVFLYMDTPDDRIGWDKTYMVCIGGYGVFGFIDTFVEELL